MEPNENLEFNRRITDAEPKSKIIQILRKNVSKKIALIILILALAIYAFFYFVINPPSGFPSGRTITLEEGMSLKEAASYLKKERVVASEAWLRNIVIALAGDKSVIAGDYYFERPVSILRVASTITDLGYRIGYIRVTIPEGYMVSEMAEVFDKKLPRFDKETFIEKAGPLEGYLFPDTYFFSPGSTEDNIIAELTKNFERKVGALAEDIEETGRTLEDIITMASIIELEGKTEESRRIISGILWRRMAIGMPLQVDATFIYINGKGSLQLTREDLAMDNPYNTYVYRGLPPGPIANPGLESIKAAIYPISSKYLYYLSDRDGDMYYAEDFEKHKENRLRYLP
jgi:UPF0755 protein